MEYKRQGRYNYDPKEEGLVGLRHQAERFWLRARPIVVGLAEWTLWTAAAVLLFTVGAVFTVFELFGFLSIVADVFGDDA